MANAPGRDSAAIERAVAELIRSLGLDPAGEPELAATPARVAALYAEIFSGLDPARAPDLAVIPHRGDGDELVLVRDLEFHSLCLHHFVPFFGRATIGYVPDRALLGISAPARQIGRASCRERV